MRSFAFATPSRRVSRCVPPAPGMIPSLVSGRPIFVTECPDEPHTALVRSDPFDYINVGKRELTCDPQVTCKSELKPATEGRAVYCGKCGDGETLERTERAAEVDKELVDLRFGHGCSFDQVRARTERAGR